MDMTILLCLAAICLSFGIGYIIIPYMVKLCLHNQWTDLPGHRKVHTQPIPRLGGVVFMPTMLICMLLALSMYKWTQGETQEFQLSTLYMALGVLAIYIVGLVDDIHELNANTKFLVQFVAALIFPFCNLLVSDLHGFCGIHELPFIVSYALTVFVILLITNAMNLIDGIDGLASGLSILILTCFIVLFAQTNFITFALLASSITGCLIAFFIYNVWGKVGGNKIFMGDSGSLFLGYVIAYLAIKYQMQPVKMQIDDHTPLLYSFTLVIIPTFDVIRVALNRKLHGKDMFCPDKTHIHHLIMDMGLSMQQTLCVVLSLFVILCALNYCLNDVTIPFSVIVALDVLLYSLFIYGTKLLQQNK